MPRVLVVADEPWVRNDVRASLSEARFELTETDDSLQAVAAAGEPHPDAVVVDLQVGSMGGMAVTRALRDAAATGRVPQVPIVILLDRRADAFLARRAGADAWLQKPFTGLALRRLLDELIAARIGEEAAE
ncbi:MAG: response regulator [Acidimicrobiia bacterium]